MTQCESITMTVQGIVEFCVNAPQLQDVRQAPEAPGTESIAAFQRQMVTPAHAQVTESQCRQACPERLLGQTMPEGAQALGIAQSPHSPLQDKRLFNHMDCPPPQANHGCAAGTDTTAGPMSAPQTQTQERLPMLHFQEMDIQPHIPTGTPEASRPSGDRGQVTAAPDPMASTGYPAAPVLGQAQKPAQAPDATPAGPHPQRTPASHAAPNSATPQTVPGGGHLASGDDTVPQLPSSATPEAPPTGSLPAPLERPHSHVTEAETQRSAHDRLPAAMNAPEQPHRRPAILGGISLPAASATPPDPLRHGPRDPAIASSPLVPQAPFAAPEAPQTDSPAILPDRAVSGQRPMTVPVTVQENHSAPQTEGTLPRQPEAPAPGLPGGLQQTLVSASATSQTAAVSREQAPAALDISRHDMVSEEATNHNRISIRQQAAQLTQATGDQASQPLEGTARQAEADSALSVPHGQAPAPETSLPQMHPVIVRQPPRRDQPARDMTVPQESGAPRPVLTHMRHGSQELPAQPAALPPRLQAHSPQDGAPTSADAPVPTPVPGEPMVPHALQEPEAPGFQHAAQQPEARPAPNLPDSAPALNLHVPGEPAALRNLTGQPQTRRTEPETLPQTNRPLHAMVQTPGPQAHSLAEPGQPQPLQTSKAPTAVPSQQIASMPPKVSQSESPVMAGRQEAVFPPRPAETPMPETEPAMRPSALPDTDLRPPATTMAERPASTGDTIGQPAEAHGSATAKRPFQPVLTPSASQGMLTAADPMPHGPQTPSAASPQIMHGAPEPGPAAQPDQPGSHADAQHLHSFKGTVSPQHATAFITDMPQADQPAEPPIRHTFHEGRKTTTADMREETDRQTLRGLPQPTNLPLDPAALPQIMALDAAPPAVTPTVLSTMTDLALPQTELVGTLVTEVSDTLMTHFDPKTGLGEIRLILKPAVLGGTEIRMIGDARQVNITFFTYDAAATTLIASNQQYLAETVMARTRMNVQVSVVDVINRRRTTSLA